MEDSFRVRVDKVFGSLAASSSSHSASSLWCLSDEEIEKREWNRPRPNPDDDEPKPYPPNLDGFFSNQPQPTLSSQTAPSNSSIHLDADLTEEKRLPRQSVKPEDYNDEEWDIRTSIGLDPTLDIEEEEDPYDKLTIGREESGDRLYMGDITDYRIAINSCNELPNTLKDVTRDSRANHMAAKLRLKEDAETTQNSDPLWVPDNTVSPASNTQNNTFKDEINLKSVMRRENQMDTKSKKRVRFEPECKDYSDEAFDGVSNLAMETSSIKGDSSFVPDYILNPSKYTHYTFDDSSSDMDEDSNQKAFTDFLNLRKGPSTTESQDEIPFELPKSVTFIAKKQSGDASMKNKNQLMKNEEDDCREKKGFPTIVAASAEESEICTMEEDEPEIAAANSSSSLRKTGRQYRTKAVSDLDEVHS